MRFLPLPVVLFLVQACDGEVVVETENQAPGAPTVSIGPTSPVTGDDLVAVIDGDAADPEGDAVTYSYSWKQDGLPRADLTTNTVPNAETTKGEVWEVSVTPNDGDVDGAAATATTTIANALPTATIAFNPEVPVAGDDVQAVATGLDDDGDPVTFTYAWMLDGGPDDNVTDTISADRTEHGQQWAVTVTPADVEGPGLPVTAEVEIANSAPEVLTLTLVPAEPYVTDDVVAVVTGYDADADAITYSYTFFVDGTEVQSGDRDTLVAGSFAKHQRISVEVVPNDGFDDGEAFVSADAEVQNSLPTATSVAIDPATAYETSTLTCLPAGFADDDGDAEGWTYAWSVNGAEVATTATLDGAAFNKGDAVTCAATPFDGEESGEAVTSSLTVSNTAPVLTGVTLSTVAPTENDTITVSLGAASDDDGDSITYSYDWYVNGSMVSTSGSLLPNRFNKGDSIYVVVTPWDGSALGTPITSDTATGANTAPTVTTVTLSSSTVYTNDTLTAAVSATDLDGDTLSYSYDWYVDGVPRGSATSATLSGATYFDKGQSIYVVITPNDGSVDGTTGTSSTVTVSNTAPTEPGVEVTPADAVEGDDLTCAVTTASTDADGDALTYAFAWDVAGVAYTSATDSATDSVVDGADVGGSEEWACAVVATDPEGASTEAEASVTVAATCVDEVCDGIDNNCDGVVDEDTAVDADTWYADADGDTYGDAASPQNACSQPAGYVADDTDCDDTRLETNPGATEYCNGYVDDDCDPSSPEDGTASWTDSAGSVTDITSSVTGTASSPAVVSLGTDGTLAFCDGTFFVSIVSTANVTITAQNGDPTTAILDAGGTASVISSVTSGASLEVSNLTLTGGLGSLSGVYGAGTGGAIQCEYGTLSVDGVIADGNEADYHGGAIAAYSCPTTIANSTLSNNAAGAYGGAALVYLADLTMTSSEVTGNEAQVGGGMFLGEGTQALTDVAVSANTADTAGGIWLYDGSASFDEVGVDGNSANEVGGAYLDSTTLDWTGSATSSSGATSNSDDVYGAVYLAGPSTLTVASVDFGTSATGSDNSPYDLGVDDASYYMASDDESFSCTAAGCGTAYGTTVGGTSNNNDKVGFIFSTVFLATTNGTLNTFAPYTKAYPATGCYIDYYLLSSPTGGDPWTVEWADLGNPAQASLDYDTSGMVGIPVESGVYYALSWGNRGCTNNCYYRAAAGNGAVITGLGTTVAEGYTRSTGTLAVGDAVTHFVTSYADLAMSINATAL